MSPRRCANGSAATGATAATSSTGGAPPIIKRSTALTASVFAFTIVPRHVLGQGMTPPSDLVNIAVVGINELGIELARNIFVKKFLEEHTDCTHLFFIDGDLKFEARAFIGLMKSGHPVCAGVYRRRQEPEDYPYKAAPDPENGGLWFVEDWLQCDRVPTGFLCIERSVLEEMAKDAPKIHVHNQGLVPWVFHPSFGGKWVPEDGASFIGEDYGFCDDYVKKYGKKIQVWTNFDFTHSGHKGNLFKWLTKANEKSEPTQPSNIACKSKPFPNPNPPTLLDAVIAWIKRVLSYRWA